MINLKAEECEINYKIISRTVEKQWLVLPRVGKNRKQRELPNVTGRTIN